MSNDNNNISKPEVIIQKGKVVSSKPNSYMCFFFISHFYLLNSLKLILKKACKEFLLKGDELLASKLQDEECKLLFHIFFCYINLTQNFLFLSSSL